MMDPTRGEFIPVDPKRKELAVWQVGEVVKLKGDEYLVLEIHARRLVLEPVAQDAMDERAPLNRRDRRALERLRRKGRA